MLTEFWVSLVFVFVLWFEIVAFWVCVLPDYVGVWVIWAFAILMVCWICEVGLLVADSWLLCWYLVCICGICGSCLFRVLGCRFGIGIYVSFGMCFAPIQ